MSRPNPHLLVPVSCLPFVPGGALCWPADGSANSEFWCEAMEPASADWLLDLSEPYQRPEKRGGSCFSRHLDDRLDVLPWALDLLGWACCEFTCAIEEGRVLVVDGQIRVSEPGPFGGSGRWVDPPPGLPNLDGFTPESQERVVVAQALRALGGRRG